MSMKQIQKAIATEDFDGISNLREKRAKELLVLLNNLNFGFFRKPSVLN